jgi:ribosomal protein RSM22 (predicted rRNA methylase)
VQLPSHIREAIEARAHQVGFAALRGAAAAMSDAYRQGDLSALARLPAADRMAAYLVTRMPATYAAAYAVLGEVARRFGGAIGSILDIGAGAGAASLAAQHWFPQASIAMIERDAAMAQAAREWLPDARSIVDDVTRIPLLPPHDLVMAAYSLGEFATDQAPRIWQAARAAMVAIEPGTPAGFALVRDIRSMLLASGAHMLAPCPGGMECPIEAPDWCHFSARVERSALHRRLKAAELNYEDEKFSYIAVTREPVETAHARIVRRPEHRPGLILLATCTPAGLAEARVTRRDRESFRAARQASWGDAWSG